MNHCCNTWRHTKQWSHLFELSSWISCKLKVWLYMNLARPDNRHTLTVSTHIRWKTLNFALRLLGFLLCSYSLGIIGFLVRMFPKDAVAWCVSYSDPSFSRPAALKKACFTILSSKEWNVITASLPWGARLPMQAGMAFSRWSSSLFTAIRKACKYSKSRQITCKQNAWLTELHGKSSTMKSESPLWNHDCMHDSH